MRAGLDQQCFASGRIEAEAGHFGAYRLDLVPGSVTGGAIDWGRTPPPAMAGLGYPSDGSYDFAAILRGIHLAREGLIASLLGFNFGVEAGQFAVVLVSYPLVVLIQRSPQRRLLVGFASGAILVLALFWFIQRAFAP